ncbi:hypothetical protein CALVIDRAFT_524988 [Calocera viscosa TUFC12733]|uniref:Ricin B lectin domain-containing protein n=1 Tax=Calocera viscosa (strain TUFC12733) TaxID=1330018 RepID=A0A167QMH1_CALVF|nr:hypothetical protein CALVIDRAFT_524988 [Calocera viscosa TUFC12733]
MSNPPPFEKLPALGKAIQILDGTYTIVNVASGTALKVKETQYVVGDSRELPVSEQPKEQWTLKYDYTEKGYTLVNGSTGNGLTSDQLYTPLVQGQVEVFQGTSKSYFTLHISSITGAYSIVPNDYASQVVELFQGSGAPGTAVQIVDSDGSTKQLWTFGADPK